MAETDVIELGMSMRFMISLKNAVSLLKPVWTRCNELALGIKTEPVRCNNNESRDQREWWRGELSKNARYSDNFHYATIDYWNIRKIVRVLELGPEDIFYDIGSGMGRILCMVARRHVRKCVGIELLDPLCQVARRNAASLRRRKAPIEIVCGDATSADLTDGTIYFMFNPFGAETLRATLDRIKQSLSEKPRSIKVVYYNATHQSVLEGLEWLVKVQEFESFGGQRVTFWENLRSNDGGVFSGTLRQGRREDMWVRRCVQ